MFNYAVLQIIIFINQELDLTLYGMIYVLKWHVILGSNTKMAGADIYSI